LADFHPFCKNCLQELKEILPSALSFFQNWKNSLDLGHRENFLADFYPIEILPWNISSNLDLAKCLATLLKIGEKSVFCSKTILKVELLQFFKKFVRLIKIFFTEWL
jgi:hypothetical protein